jgi:hypothetical protein
MTTCELIEHEREVQHWKHVAAYLASCHAATLEGLPKSAPKSQRRRHVEICRSAAAYLRGKESPPWYGTESKDVAIERDIVRCEKAAQKHGALANVDVSREA